MKIAFVSSGQSIHVKKIANELVKYGHELHLYTLPNHTSMISEFDSRIKIIFLRFSGKLGYYLNSFELKKLIEKENYDVINAHYASGYGTMLRNAKVGPSMLSVFGSDVYVYPFKSNFNMKTMVKNLDYADVLSSTSKVMEEKLKSFYRNNRKIHITNFGVDVNNFQKVEQIRDSNNEFIFGVIKKIEEIYGYIYLFNAFKMLIESVKKCEKKVKLKIYGRGSKREEYEKYCREIGLSDYVEFCGFVPNEKIPQVLSELDAVCLPSISESFGVAAIEAMACEVPVISSDAEGFTEVIEEGETGFIVPKKNEKALFDKMLYMYNMPNENRIQMGLNGRKRVLKYYNFNENIIDYIKVLEMAAASKT
jgi:L-malate glycosyltransferase